MVFGGEMKSYSSVIDRGRREAILRMKEASPEADLFLNCRLETSSVSKGQGKAVGCAEVLAYATAVRFQRTGGMKFVPRKIEKTADNSRGKESWKDKLKNLTSVVGVLAVLYFAIGLLADFVAMRISEETEGKVFGSAVSVLQSEIRPAAVRVWRRKPSIGSSGTASCDRCPTRLVYWDESSPNAFAVPGGGVIVTQGLLDAVTNETALAFVLGSRVGAPSAPPHAPGRRPRPADFVGLQLHLRIDRGGCRFWCR